MGIADAFKETPEMLLKTPTVFQLLDRSARLRYLERAVVCGIPQDQLIKVFELEGLQRELLSETEEDKNGDSE